MFPRISYLVWCRVTTSLLDGVWPDDLAISFWNSRFPLPARAFIDGVETVESNQKRSKSSQQHQRVRKPVKLGSGTDQLFYTGNV
ncbi:hypothetical protein B0T24DRAFT_635930 [Lasiosphaeria ovina]|uniref:Uncharacterized protein n=1 Tax=Lasiosphaeria ovina TaxID=92902 RepID=A0AAE0N098_9PEZI|nr:hypothetical protein B0T24DRAFT_635930 [Lasiosphaeria ovina]